MTDNEVAGRRKLAQQKRLIMQEKKGDVEKEKFGRRTLKHFGILLGLMLASGVIIQVVHAPVTRILYWEGGSCYSCLKISPSRSNFTNSGPLPALFVFNDLGYPAECGKTLGNYFAGAGMTVYLFDYFAAPLTSDNTFNFTGYFQNFTSHLVETAQANASDLYFIGFGLGATCALTLAETLPPRALIAINAISNFSRVIPRSGQSPRDDLEAAQWARWNIQLQNYGYISFFSSLNESRLGDFIPTLHVSRSQSNTTLLVRTSGNPACTSLDQDELRERLHCETWVIGGNGDNALLDAQLHADLTQWLSGQGLLNSTPPQPITLWVDATYVPAVGFLVGIISIVLVRDLKLKRDDQPSHGPHRVRPSATAITSLVLNMAGIIGLILNWGNLQALLWISGVIIGIQLAMYSVRWKMGMFHLDTWKFEERKTPRKDLLVTFGIYGAFLLLSLLLYEPPLLPRGRNLPCVIALSIVWMGFYLVNLANAVDERKRGGGTPRSRLSGVSLRIFGIITLAGEWTVLDNPLLLSQYPLALLCFAGFIFIALSLPALASKLDFFPLFLTVGLSYCFF